MTGKDGAPLLADLLPVVAQQVEASVQLGDGLCYVRPAVLDKLDVRPQMRRVVRADDNRVGLVRKHEREGKRGRIVRLARDGSGPLHRLNSLVVLAPFVYPRFGIVVGYVLKLK